MMSIPIARVMVIDGGREDSQEQNSQQNTESQETAQVPEGRPRHPYEIEVLNGSSYRKWYQCYHFRAHLCMPSTCHRLPSNPNKNSNQIH